MKTYSHRGVLLPEHLHESLQAYIEHGRPTGGFLQAVIDNQLKEACGRADDESIAVLPVLVAFLVNEAPMACWGRAGRYQEWITEKHIQRTQKEQSACPQQSR